jgi:hypothetical protein
MAQVKDSMGGIMYNTPKVVTVAAIPVTNVEAAPAGQEQPLATPKAAAAAAAAAATAVARENADECAGSHSSASS